MIGLRVRVRPKSRDAKQKFIYDLKRCDIMYVTDRKRLWHLFNPNSGMSLYVHPTDDPNWEIIR
jgi:hypothetical protein|tara:strand:+ start:1856 stop:2047 length:192 start_codon:yes stop_codon:yes gene_type:complete